jgi:cysteinyl-tRNA synthetase
MLKLFNSLTRKLEDFKPLKDKTVTMYNCGPTVYDYPHIGNLRAWLFADTLRRYLEFSGYKVKQVMNITDVGHMQGDADTGVDKLEAAAAHEKIDPLAVARKYEKIFFEYLKALNFEPAFKYPRASEHVKEMIAMIEKLVKNGFAYVAGGDVYFDVSKFPAYGRLSGNTVAALDAGHRVEINPKKKSPFDFALWIHNPSHLLKWDSPWSHGYPGWHIECSAMATKYLGETIDIHTGAEDNKFPHHECEIAQSEGASGKPFVRYWLHLAHLLVDGGKMSKSLNNFFTLDDLLAKGYSPDAVRYALVMTHYREQQNFTLEALEAAEKAVAKLKAVHSRFVEKNKKGKAAAILAKATEAVRLEFAEAMDGDLNVPKALGAIFDFVRELNAAFDNGGVKERSSAKKIFEKIVSGVLGIGLDAKPEGTVPAPVLELSKEREAARQNKDYKKADELRGKIKELGFEVVDRDGGAEVKKL